LRGMSHQIRAPTSSCVSAVAGQEARGDLPLSQPCAKSGIASSTGRTEVWEAAHLATQSGIDDDPLPFPEPFHLGAHLSDDAYVFVAYGEGEGDEG